MEEEEDGAQGNYEPRKDTNAKTDNNTRVIETEEGERKEKKLRIERKKERKNIGGHKTRSD